ncbi:proto-oncogene tyrosine-protein kinase ROS-like isoform X2 [Nylanderia fulva]|uniref:proto-oncogene tyrosine-protein kinase ROS-like isoform X2 n=1 Tax=Nylanderia fulva TaxID=613905 RepID=UPI0010FB534E|nr:proto-oncogene tyrosine-protein kinase ROS-like isoform X2 [Nylanderia fulva]
MDLQKIYELNKYRTKEIIYSALEHKLYWINEVSELISYDFNANTMKTNHIYTKIVDLDSSAHNLCIDWIARNLYWIQDANHTKNIMKLDLTLWEQTGLAKYDSILQINESKFLNIVPLKGYIYWMELNSNNQYVIKQSDLDGKNKKSFLEDKDNECLCPYKLQEASTMHIDNTNIDEPLMYWTSKDHLIAGRDIYGCRCRLVLSAGNQKFFNYLTIDKTNIYLFSRDELQSIVYLYMLNKKYALIESNENAFKHVPKNHGFVEPINSVIALDVSSQPYPPTTCLIPKVKNYAIKVTNITANSIIVNLPEPDPNDGCEKYNLPTTIYIISVSHCLDNDRNKFKKRNEQTHKSHYEIKNLTPFTEYRLKLALSNFYVDKFSMDLQFGEDVIQKTNSGKFNAPENVTVQVLTPTLAKIYWMPPQNLNCAQQVNYEVHWKSILFSNGTRKITHQVPHIEQLFKLERTVDGKFFTIIQSPLPGQEYSIYVRVYPANFSNFFTDSVDISAHMYSEPNNLTLSGISTNSMAISWIPSHNLINYKLEYKNVTMQPGTFYNFRLILKYPEHMEDFIWPLDERFYTFKTLADIPSAPGIPMITRLPNSTYQLKWKPAQVHDSQVSLYRLEGLIVENNYKEDNQANKHWNLYYNGTHNHWIMTKSMNQKYRFRVQAGNAYGFGEWSETSAEVDLTDSIEILAAHYYYYLLLPFVLSLIVTLAVYNVYYFYCSYRQREGVNDPVLPAIMTDIELVTQSELSHECVQLNKLYDFKLQHNLDKCNLRIIKKEQITRTKLLGSGQFGKVFQGTVEILEGVNTMPVAIKILRENASSDDKDNILKEAKLMSYFHHKHVVKLLFVCSDIDSPMLISELMEGGDLLKYLQECQKLQSSDPRFLRLQDLLAMCEDVARGCCYLEKLHFVHRDLACRNCLISSRNRENRIVKISDFGLARNLYKNAYYRTKGEGPLPLRWMALESLMYRKFTSQSDVWSFGVLIWEIMTLGEHPYSTKNDSEVWQYVCAGGKLPKPLNCPLMLYELMHRCWSPINARPNFTICLENIITLRNNIEDTIPSSADSIRYVELPSSGKLEGSVESIAHPTSERLTTNDAPNIIEYSTLSHS